MTQDKTVGRLADEPLFQALFTTALDAVLITDDERRYLEANPAACELLGRSRDEILRLSIDDVAAVEANDVRLNWHRFLADGEQRGDFAILRADGTRRIVEFAARANFVPGRHLSILRDVTTRRQAEETIGREATRKDDFLAVLAHELRHPLAPLGNALRLARLDDQRDYALELAGRQLRRLSRLVDDLLDVSRIGQDKLELRRQLVEIHRVIEPAVEAARTGIERRGHRLTVSLPSEPLRVDADPARLEQILVNLLGNATKYTDPGGRIDLFVDRVGDDVRIRVRDNGIGIPADMLPRVFTLFIQSDRARSHTPGGLGIGLTLVRHLVEAHGGRVDVASAGPGCGSEFTVWLPVCSDVAAADSTVPLAPLPCRPLRILVVDDSVDLTDSLTILLQAGGHRVQVAYDGPGGLEAARRDPPDVALVDLGLPGMNGLEVARRIRQEAALAGTVLIALSGYGRDEDREAAREAGFDHHLLKPVDIETIEAMLATIEPTQPADDDAGRSPLLAELRRPGATARPPEGAER